MVQIMKTHLLKLVESFIKDEYNLEWIDMDIKINDASGKLKTLGHLFHDEKNEECWEMTE